MLKFSFFVLASLLLFPVTSLAQQSNETIEFCQRAKQIVESTHRLRQNHTREELEPMLVNIGIDLELFYPFLDGAYAMPVAANLTELEMHVSGISAMAYVNCLATDGFRNELPQ